MRPMKLGPITLEFHRTRSNRGERFRLELFRGVAPCRWDFIIEFWRSH